MNKFTALTLAAAIVPALALGTAAFAEQSTGGTEADDEGLNDQGIEWTDEQRDEELRTDEDRDDELRAGEDWEDEQRAGEDRDDELGADERAGEDRDDEQFMSSAPAGALYTDGVIGKTVKHRESGENVGEIKDLLIGEDGRVLGAVITMGGFLGLGGQEVSLGWNQLERTMEDDRSVFYVDMDKETLRNAPEHERESETERESEFENESEFD